MQKRAFKEDRKKKILEHATRCFAENPGATLKDVSAFASIGIATLHRYFPSREDLLRAIALCALELTKEALDSLDFTEPDIHTLLVHVAEKLLPLGDRMHFLFAQFFHTADLELEEKEREIERRFVTEFQNRQASGQLRGDLGANWMFYTLYHVLFMLWKEIHDGNIASKEAPRIFVATLLDGFSSKP